jgi:hypothetical protein
VHGKPSTHEGRVQGPHAGRYPRGQARGATPEGVTL